MRLEINLKIQSLTAYITASNSDEVKLQSVDSLVMNNDTVTISTAPKKYEYAVTDRFAGYFLNTGA